MRRLLLVFAVFLLCAPKAFTQSLALETVADPTTYIPMATFYASAQLDWNSSQPHFARGETEVNARFTQSGLPYSAPVSYGRGNRLIICDALQIGALSAANNLVMHLMERRFAAAPEHFTAWKRLGRIERIAVASALAFGLSRRHFEQWHTNAGVQR